MAKTVSQFFEKNVVKNVQSVQGIPTGCLPVGLKDNFQCPKCKTELNVVGHNVNAAMFFSCPLESCNAQMVRWEIDDEVSNCRDCNVEFFTFRTWSDYVRKSHCRVCGQIFCSQCLEERLLPGYGKKILDKYYVKQKACRPCIEKVLAAAEANDEGAEGAMDSAAMSTAVPPPPPIADAPATAAVAAPASNNTGSIRIGASNATNPEFSEAFGAALDQEKAAKEPSKPVAKSPRRSTVPAPRKKGLFDDDEDGDPFAPASESKEAEKPAKKSLGLFEEDTSSEIFAAAPIAPHVEDTSHETQGAGLFDD